eukprot:jgi/Tetstr1/444085/TSEL_003323.t2
MLAASTASKKGSSSDGGIMRLRKPVCRTAHTTSNRMAPWWQPYPDVPKEAMRSNSVAWASRRRPNAPVTQVHGAILDRIIGRAWAEARRTSTEPTPSGRTRSGSPLFSRSSRAAGSSLWSAKTEPLAKKAAVREWHRPARQRFTHRRHEGALTGSAPPISKGHRPSPACNMALIVSDQPTPLHEALTRHAPPEEVQQVLRGRRGDAAVMYKGYLPLQHAVEYELPVDVTREILDAFRDALEQRTHGLDDELAELGEDSDIDSDDDATVDCPSTDLPLHLALQYSSAEVARMLWQAKPKTLEELSGGGCPPLCLALKHHPMATELLLEILGQHPAAAKEKGDHELDYALNVALKSPNIDVKVVRALLREFPGAISIMSQDGHVPLNQAIVAGAGLPIVSLLLEEDDSALLKRSDDPYLLPLQMAVETGAALPVVRLLMDKKRDVAKYKKKPLLHIALQPGTQTDHLRGNQPRPSLQSDIVNHVLGECPEAVEWRDSDGYLPLHRAAESAAPPDITLDLLRRFPAAAQAATPSGHTALHLAARQADTLLSVVQALVAENSAAVFTAAGEEAHLPIHAAAAGGSPEVVKFLLDISPPAPPAAGAVDAATSQLGSHQEFPLPAVQQSTAGGSLPLHLAATMQLSPGETVTHILSHFPGAAPIPIPGDRGMSVFHALLENERSSFGAVESVLREYPDAARDERCWDCLLDWLLRQPKRKDTAISLVDACPHLLFALVKEPKLKGVVAEIVKRRPELREWRKGDAIPTPQGVIQPPPPIVATALTSPMRPTQETLEAGQGRHTGSGANRERSPAGSRAAAPSLKPGIQDHQQQESRATPPPELGLTLFEAADGAVRKEIDVQLSFLGQYQLESTEPAHASATCIVMFASDIGNQSLKEHSNGRVALKLMRSARQFRQELEMRKKRRLSDKHVVPVLCAYAEQGEELACQGLQLPELHRVPAVGAALPPLRSSPGDKEAVEYRFCIVMDRAVGTLDAALTHERFAGHNWVRVRDIGSSIGEALKHLHKRGIVHGDFKPLNVVRVGMDWKLIDLDASCMSGSGFGDKEPSSGYCPPEMARILRTPGAGGGRPELQSYTAHPAYDMWSFGVVMFHMATGKKLWHADQDDNIAEGDMDKLASWDQWKRDDCLTEAGMDAPGREPLRDLLEKLLAGDPGERAAAFPNGMSDVLKHGFFHGTTSADIARLDTYMDSMLQKLNAQASMLHHLLDDAKDFPGLLCMVPPDTGLSRWKSLLRPGGWMGQEVNIFFVDPITFSLADTNFGKGFGLVFAREWVKKAAPYLKVGITVLKLAAGAGRLAGVPVPDVMGMLESQLDALTGGGLFEETKEWLTSKMDGPAEEALEGLEERISGVVQFSADHGAQPGDSKQQALSAWVLPKHKADFEVQGRRLMGMSSQVQQRVVEGQHELLGAARAREKRLMEENDALKRKIAMLEAIGEPLGAVMPDSRTLPGVVNEDGEHAELRDRQMQEMAVAVSNRVADRLQRHRLRGGGAKVNVGLTSARASMLVDGSNARSLQQEQDRGSLTQSARQRGCLFNKPTTPYCYFICKVGYDDFDYCDTDSPDVPAGTPVRSKREPAARRAPPKVKRVKGK